jgi:hypothetical protein
MTKVVVDIPDELLAYLKYRAEVNQKTATTILLNAVVLHKYFSDLKEFDGNVYIKRNKHGDLHSLNWNYL